MNPNPLNLYFRHPVLQVSLPSLGKFYPKNSIELIDNNEYSVLAMTRQDELVFMTAVAQNNSHALVSIVESCVPNIKNAWKMPVIDIDKLLVAVKIATHGAALAVDTECPNCETKNTITVDLKDAMEKIAAVDYSEPAVIQDLKIYFRPISYQQMTDNNRIQFDGEDLETLLQDTTVADTVKAEKMDLLLQKVRSLATLVLTQNISSVETPTARVTEPAHISEWLNNCDRNTYMLLQDHIVLTKTQTELAPAAVTCTNCSTAYQHAYSLDMANSQQ
jgi:hypothetical protein